MCLSFEESLAGCSMLQSLRDSEVEVLTLAYHFQATRIAMHLARCRVSHRLVTLSRPTHVTETSHRVVNSFHLGLPR